jgi:acyl carrier protein
LLASRAAGRPRGHLANECYDQLKLTKGAQVETVISDFISQELVREPALLPLTDETSLLESGILDSLSLLQLVVFLEERFGIIVGDADLLPENFASVNTICSYLRALESEKRVAHG